MSIYLKKKSFLVYREQNDNWIFLKYWIIILKHKYIHLLSCFRDICIALPSYGEYPCTHVPKFTCTRINSNDSLLLWITPLLYMITLCYRVKTHGH